MLRKHDVYAEKIENSDSTSGAGMCCDKTRQDGSQWIKISKNGSKGSKWVHKGPNEHGGHGGHGGYGGMVGMLVWWVLRV